MPLLTDDDPVCTYRGCTKAPTSFLRRTTDRTGWFGCPAHAAAMEDALKIGLSGTDSGSAWVDVTPLRAGS